MQGIPRSPKSSSSTSSTVGSPGSACVGAFENSPKTTPATRSNTPARSMCVRVRSNSYSPTFTSSKNRMVPSNTGRNGVPSKQANVVRFPPTARPATRPPLMDRSSARPRWKGSSCEPLLINPTYIKIYQKFKSPIQGFSFGKKFILF